MTCSSHTLGFGATDVAIGRPSAAIVYADFNSDGLMDFATLGTDDTLSVLLGNGDGTFAIPQSYTLADTVLNFGPQAMVTADFDDDGNADIAVVEDGAVQLFKGSPSGTLTPQPVITLSNTLSDSAGIASGDFNGDGKPDLAVWANDSHAIGILTNGGNLAFTESNPDLSVLSDVPSTIRAADVDGDGTIDLVVGSEQQDGLFVVLNKSGGFSNQGLTTLPSAPVTLTLADLDGDTHPDIVVGLEDASVQVLLNSGSGSYGAPKSLGTLVGNPAYQIGVADVTGDKRPDIVVQAYNELAVWPSAGAGAWGPPQAFMPGLPGGLGVVDVNGDGLADVIAGDTGPNDVSVLLASPPNLLAAPNALYSPTSSAFGAPLIVDVNGDGHPDLVAVSYGSNEVGVWLNNGDGSLGAVTTYGVGTGANPSNVVAADFNGDGNIDLAVACPGLGKIGLLLGSGGGKFKPVTEITASPSNTVLTDDFNGDNKPDLLAWSSQNGAFTVLLANGSASVFAAPTPQPTSLPANTTQLVAAKVSSGSPVDLIGVSYGCPNNCNGASVFSMIGNGDGTFGSSTSSAVTNSYFGAYAAIAVGDFTNDGNLDALVYSFPEGGDSTFYSFDLCKGDGSGGFTCGMAFADPFTNQASSSAIVAGDFNGDGNLDVAVNESGVFGIGVLLGDGKGNFSPGFFRSVNAAVDGLAVGDLAGDGLPSLAYGLGNGAGEMVNVCK